METILNQKIGTLFNLRFCKELSFEDAVQWWKSIIPLFIPFVHTALEGIITTKVKSPAHISSCIETFISLVELTRDANKEQYNRFAEQVELVKL